MYFNNTFLLMSFLSLFTGNQSFVPPLVKQGVVSILSRKSWETPEYGNQMTRATTFACYFSQDSHANLYQNIFHYVTFKIIKINFVHGFSKVVEKD